MGRLLSGDGIKSEEEETVHGASRIHPTAHCYFFLEAIKFILLILKLRDLEPQEGK